MANPTAHAMISGVSYTTPVVVPAGGDYTTAPASTLDVQIAEYLNLVVTTTGETGADVSDIVVYVETMGKTGKWNTGLPIAVYIPVKGDVATVSSVVMNVMSAQEVRIGRISNPNAGDVTVQIEGDCKG